ncbi:MAG: helix-turn-helix domain-containing protein [Actinophytocola sp.]|uniref:helix-turn-helix domain-containing protein n=1 Tax=Actinophytocola sp. TaxID=1872138 RepID=UPI003D6B32F7
MRGGSCDLEGGVFIVRARVAAGLSQRALADATGISQPLLRIISGDRIVKMPDVVAISRQPGTPSPSSPALERWPTEAAGHLRPDVSFWPGRMLRPGPLGTSRSSPD